MKKSVLHITRPCILSVQVITVQRMYHNRLDHEIFNNFFLSSCLNTTRAHRKRHNEIAKFVQAIHRLDGTLSTDCPLWNNKRKSKKKDDPDPNLDPLDDGIVRPAQADSGPEVEWDSNASTLNNEDDEAEERRLCLSEVMESPYSRKAAKAERKAAKLQVLLDVITQEELTMIEEALHPQAEKQANAISKGQGLADNQTIDENITFNPHTFKWGGLRQGAHAKKVAKANGGKTNTPEQDNENLKSIFAVLGIKINVSKTNKERKALVSKLRAAILRDLVAFHNDQVETMQRMAGYWRYANKRIYNEMVRNNELWDWATGEKLPEITEAELNVIEEEAENVEAGTQGVGTEALIPESWHDADFELPADLAVLAVADRYRSNKDGKGGRSDTKLNGEVEPDRDRISISKLPYSPGYLPNQTPGFNALSPLSSDKSWQRVESGDHTKEDSEIFKDTSIPRVPSSPNGPDESGFQGVRDTRVFGKAIRQASPPPKDTPHAIQPPIRSLSTSVPQHTRDPRNRFGALNYEVPAPCEEVSKADHSPAKSVIRFPTKPIVKTLVIHEDKDDWKTVRQPKSKKGKNKGGAAVALREQAAVNVQPRKFTEGKTFAAVVKRRM